MKAFLCLCVLALSAFVAESSSTGSTITGAAVTTPAGAGSGGSTTTGTYLDNFFLIYLN